MVLCKQFLDFMATQEDAVLTYQASDMVLVIHSDASYLSEPKSRSHAGGHMYMAGKDKIPINNGVVLNILQIIRAVMSSAAEAELGALFINAKTAVSMQQTLIKLGHPQLHTSIQTDNATARALLTNKILPKALKAMDMHFHWLRCRDSQDLADYFTKHHPATHHKSVCPTILTAVNDQEYRKLFMTQDTSSPQINVKSGRTIQRIPTKMSIVTNSFVKTLSQTPKFQNVIAARSA